MTLLVCTPEPAKQVAISKRYRPGLGAVEECA
jgi:hypothetical protein